MTDERVEPQGDREDREEGEEGGEPRADPGAYVGHEPEWAADTIPGGVGPKDERVAASATRSSGEGAAAHRVERREEPSGHREGPKATDDDVREAGQNR
ncbi:MAG TPA: hypothetical protein VGQ47_04030 [Candidatus Limnocylindrales bacterium]|nr:hypothetical protein [Candidatus Limnocylindrales bacterium]